MSNRVVPTKLQVLTRLLHGQGPEVLTIGSLGIVPHVSQGLDGDADALVLVLHVGGSVVHGGWEEIWKDMKTCV